MVKLAGTCRHGLLVAVWSVGNLAKLSALANEGEEHQTFEVSKPVPADVCSSLEVLWPVATASAWPTTLAMLGSSIKEYGGEVHQDTISKLKVAVGDLSWSPVLGGRHRLP